MTPAVRPADIVVCRSLSIWYLARKQVRVWERIWSVVAPAWYCLPELGSLRGAMTPAVIVDYESSLCLKDRVMVPREKLEEGLRKDWISGSINLCVVLPEFYSLHERMTWAVNRSIFIWSQTQSEEPIKETVYGLETIGSVVEFILGSGLISHRNVEQLL